MLPPSQQEVQQHWPPYQQIPAMMPRPPVLQRPRPIAKPQEPKENWENLDSLAKLKRKKALEDDLQKALEVNDKVQQVEAELRDLRNQIESNYSKLVELKADPGYRSQQQIAELSSKVTELDDIKNLLQSLVVKNDNDQDTPCRSDNERRSCPICYDDAKGKEIFSCIECEHWLCEDCNKVNTCPSCRCSLKETPLRRNKTLEIVFRD